MKNNKITVYLFLALSVLLSSCSDWTDPKSIDIDISKVSEKEKEEYYKDLRAYKATNHKITYLWFDNSTKVAQSNGQLLTSVPDSVDIICLSSPLDLTSKEIATMKELKSQKSYSFTYAVDVVDYKAQYAQLVLQANLEDEEGETEEKPELPSIQEFIQDKFSTALKASSEFDGIILRYIAKDLNFLTDDEKEEYLAVETLVFEGIETWITNNPSKFLTLQGDPSNFSNESILNSTKNIILETGNLTAKDQIAYALTQAANAGVPTDRFIISTSAISYAKDEPKVGYWPDVTGKYTLSAILQNAIVVASSDMPYNIVGLSISKGSNDYYNSVARYQNVNKGIAQMNPSPIN